MAFRVDKITILSILGIVGVGAAFYFLWPIIQNAPYPENAQPYGADSQYLRELHYKQAQNATRHDKPSSGLFNLTKAVEDQFRKANAGFILPYSSLAREEEMREPWADSALLNDQVIISLGYLLH